MSGIYTFVISVLLVVVAIIDKTNGQGGPCTTQRNDPGICVPILTCGTITQLLSISPRPLPNSVQSLVRQSHCGTFNKIHHVCCDPSRVTGGGSVPVQTTTTRTTVASTSNSVVRSGVEKSEEEIRAGLALLQGTPCGKSDADRVANGEDAELLEYPWMALLVYFDGIDRRSDCGGSLIHPRHVLTAAHCIRSGSKKLVSVILGEYDTNSAEDCSGRGSSRTCAPPIQEIDVEVAIYHKDYSPSRFSDDVGIVRLVRNAEINRGVKPICLPITPASRSYSLDRMIISGWGRMENGQKATILQKAVVPLQSLQTCQEVHRVLRITQKQMCAGGENEIDTCKGDSGGPLFYSAPYRRAARYIQYGVVSAGSIKCGSNTPGIYVRVEAYLPWIASNLN